MPTSYYTDIITTEWALKAQYTACTNTELWSEWNNAYTSSTTTATWHEWNRQWRAQVVASEQQLVSDWLGDPKPTTADAKAELLLRSVLTPDQLTDYEKHQRFDVRSQHGNLYRLKYGKVRNIQRLNHEHEPVMGYCIHPKESVPVADVLVAQKLLIEGDEDRFLQTAHAFT